MEARYTVYALPMQEVPVALQKAFLQGVIAGPIAPVTEAFNLLAHRDPCPNSVCRDPSGRLLVTCCTDLPSVTPAMIDWWFGWHLPSSDRYRLWHPKAHVAAVVKEDRSTWPNLKSRYVGNVSYVDEYIGPTLAKLAIAFKPASEFGFAQSDPEHATTVCAETSARTLNVRSGWLVHHVVRTPYGAQMRSGFWIGDFKPASRWFNAVLGPALNTAFMRRHLAEDQMALNLMLHCGEEMNHLARFLPQLYDELGPDSDEGLG